MAQKVQYLQRTQVALIFLAFAVLTVPLSVIQLSAGVPGSVKRWLMVFYLFLVGNTHFAITWALYLNSANLRHFGSTAARKLIYFAVPIAIMIMFFALGVLEIPAEGTAIAIWFFAAVTATDYFHAVRQSFGVLQMFKGRAGPGAFPRSLVRADNLYFLALWILQIITFLNGTEKGFDGRFEWSNVPAKIMLGVAGALAFVVLRGFARAWRTEKIDRGAVLVALGYFALQSASAWLVVYRSRLYFASLAMHYVEYHVLMVPRCFRAELDPSSGVDRVAAWFRRHKVVFYGAVVLVAAIVSSAPLLSLVGTQVTRDDRFGWLLVNLLGGIFVAHYFVEAFVWKFSQPFYRETLTPLYSAVPAQAAERSPAPALAPTG